MRPTWFLALIFIASPMVPKDCSEPVPIDEDADGFPAGEDCDDQDPSTFPGAIEVCGDGIDNDCDGEDIPCPTFLYLSQDRSVAINGAITVSEDGPEQSFDVYEEAEDFDAFYASISDDSELVEVFSGQNSMLDPESIRLSGASVASAYGSGETSYGFAYSESVASIEFVLSEAQVLEIQGYIQVMTPTNAGHPVAGVAFTGPSGFDLAHQVVVEDVQAWSTTFEAPAGSYRFSVYSVTDIDIFPGSESVYDGTSTYDFLLTPIED